MNIEIVCLLEHLAKQLPNDESFQNEIKKFPIQFKKIMDTNNIDSFKMCLSDKELYANVTEVTIY